VDGLPTEKKVYAYAYDPNNPKIMYVGLKDGISLSKNEGRQWSLVRKSPKGVNAIVFYPKHSEKIFAGAEDGRIFISKDGGHTWKLQNR
jgi:photosystem II stability/assembly factor-like uncharacterized protein